MKYITCIKPREFRLEQKPSPIREARLRIHRVGICGTDLHAYAGNQAFFTYPRILGYELAAEVMEVSGNDRNVKKGDKVVVMPYMNCGKCLACRKGKTSCCSNIKVLGVHIDGGMQQEITVNTALLIPTNHLSWEQMAIVEPLAIPLIMPQGKTIIASLSNKNSNFKISSVELVGSKEKVKWSQAIEGLIIEPFEQYPSNYAPVFKITFQK